MFSPKIVPYQPNATVRSRRIDPKDWERLRPRLEELYLKDDKKLEEVMEIMALNESFHASRRQYTQKFNEWGLCKNFPAKAMKSALRKRARAGKDDLPIKYRGTAITKDSLDRWQQRVPSFNPMSSPTASTPSQMNVEIQHVATPKLQSDALQNLVVQSPSISVSNDDRADYDDDVVNKAYDEIRRSVSPRIAEYIFRPRENRSFSPNNTLAEEGWTLDSILNISITEYDVMHLSHKSWDTLKEIADNLWRFGEQKYVNYFVHIYELLNAGIRLKGTTNPKYVEVLRKNLALGYLWIGRATECEAILIALIAKTEFLRPGDPTGDDFRSFLGVLRLRQGHHSLAEQLCRQAMLRLRSTVGLAHNRTWKTCHRLRLVLQAQGRFDDVRRLMTDFYSDVHRTVSAQVLPRLNALLELCRSYIERWMDESKLQRLATGQLVDDIPFGIGAKSTLILSAVVRERLREERSQGVLRMFEDLQDLTGLQAGDLLSTASLLIAWRIRPIQHLDPISLRQEALRVIQDLRSTRILLPLWIFMFVNGSPFRKHNYNLRTDEYNIIQSLEDVVIGRSRSTEAASFKPSADADSSVSVLGITGSRTIGQSDLLNSSESSMSIPTAPGRAFSLETSTRTLSLYLGTGIPSALSSTTPAPPQTSAYKFIH